MDITVYSDYLNSQNIPLYSLVILFAIFLTIIIFLFIIIISLYKKVRKLTIARYGFGGKPIFSIFILFALIIFIPFTMYSVQKTFEYVNYANATKDVVLSIYIDEKAFDLYSVSFISVPMINDKPWGDKVYDITWNIQGVITFEKIEKDKNINNPSYFVKELPSGQYLITVKIESDNFYVVKSESLVIKPN